MLERVSRLVDPTHTADIRFAALRAHAAALAARGQFEGAHHLLNTAGGVAQRIRSRFRVALVEGDRAMVLAAQGRLLEAITAADRVLPSLIRPAVGEHQQWANTEGAAIALTVCRAAADAGDHLTAQRMLHLGTTATQRVGGAYLSAHLDLARGVSWLLEGDLDAAEASLVNAGRQFGVLGCAPAIALATLEQGRLAQHRGLVRSARPLYLAALEDFRRLRQPREVNEVNRLLSACRPDRSPPASRSGWTPEAGRRRTDDSSDPVGEGYGAGSRPPSRTRRFRWERRPRCPAIEGWFTLDPERPALLATRCTACATYFFPRETYFCKNPDCLGREFDEVELSRTGTVWSFTNNCFEPPPPYMSPDPFVPYAIAAVELDAEKMVVLGQVVPGFDVERPARRPAGGAGPRSRSTRTTTTSTWCGSGSRSTGRRAEEERR